MYEKIILPAVLAGGKSNRFGKDKSNAKLDEEEAIALIVNGFCKEVLQKLPMEFAVEAQKLLEISLEGSVG